MQGNNNTRKKFRTSSVNAKSHDFRFLDPSTSSRPKRSQSQLEGGRKNNPLQNQPKKNISNRSRELSHFSFKYLESLLEKPLEEVIQKLTQNEHFFRYIGNELSPDNTVLIVRLLSKFCDCCFSKIRIELLHKSLTSGFANRLQNYIVSIAVQNHVEKKMNSYYWKDPDHFWNSFLKLCTVSLNESPHFFIDNLLRVVKISQLQITVIETEHEVHICDEIKNNLKSIIDRAQDIKSRSELKQSSQKKDIINDVEEDPPEDFHEISIFPTTDELVDMKKPFLRKNVVIGSYKDVNHYLDVQFRLLREDFVGPLRLGIQGFLSGKELRDIQDIKIHRRVQFLNPVTATEDFCVLLRFHFGGKKSSFKYEESKKFMFGSLVCFTRDNFQSILFGRIADRKMEYLKNGQFVVGFNNKTEVLYNTDYTMVECSIYFEPYYHVLKVLQQINEDNFPMKNYIVDVEKNVLHPNYGDRLTPYKIKSNEIVKLYYPFHPEVSLTFDDLNESQNEAFLAALTRKFSIIQGPPGTGKTYVGLKVAKTLLDNYRNWWENSPMLVICFTNHALDQFLEGLIGTTDKIIRIGGQSKNEKLGRFNLKEYARKINPGVWRARDQLNSYLMKINNISKTLKNITGFVCILDFRKFDSVIPHFHDSWLAAATNEDLLNWLLPERFPDYEEEFSLIQGFKKVTLDDSETEDSDVDNEAAEVNKLDEFLTTINSSHTQDSLLDLKTLKEHIFNNDQYLIDLESKMEEELYFEFITLKMKNEKLKAAYEFVREQLSMASTRIAEEELIDVRTSQYISLEDRWKLYFCWLDLYRKHLLEQYEKNYLAYRRRFEIYNELKEMANIEILKDMKVIGMTTTGAARLHSTLQVLKCPIVIVEEAAEVLEAHIVSALTQNCQQLILIGDHQQLRPSTANYKIETFYKLGISLFERMIMNKVQCFTLDIQHRMRPEISALIKPTIYPNLKDHESVKLRPLIKGVDKCLYFVDHKIREESHSDNSKKNLHEARFLIQLARYLILNGYHSEQITILAAYLGQMFELQKEKKKMDLLKNVRISVLDNYQGEESDIILLSLVRNNDENSIGFLSIENRVCVALSRARNGFYIMGNMTLLCNKSPLWIKINDTLLSQEAIGSSLVLKCQNHNKMTNVSTADHFSLVSEGGCDQICNYLLVCGHKCKMQCHILDPDHENYICTEKCEKLLCDSDLRHLCRKMCSEECGPCDYPKNLTLLSCGHDAVMPCHMEPEDYKCVKELQVTLPCGHNATKFCYLETEKCKCRIPCDARLDCGHSCEKLCHVFDDPDHLNYKCLKRCDKFRVGCTNGEDDSHKCSKLCYDKCEPCMKLVRKARTVCPHYYDVPCCENVDDIQCSKPCKKKFACGHSCQNMCGVQCGTCKKMVQKKIPGCNHTQLISCDEEADRKYCNKKCPRVMVCGHICGGICKIECDPKKCKEIVKVSILAKCGHIVKEVPCFVKTSYNEEGASAIKNLESYCNEPCTVILNCSPEDKHLCSGSCGSCYQGRIHRRCKNKCSRILLCNHTCTGFCRESCLPCSKKCSYKCKHSVCQNRCGDACIMCKEPCNRNCPHQKCKKKCGEICSVPPCEEPCNKNLKCGHPCIGFCSEPCPPLCRICNKEEVEEFFFGTEDEENARFVLLNDCGHILENNGMQNWLCQDEKQIKFKECPKCKTKIFTTERYSDYIKRAIDDISKAKIAGIGTRESITEKRSELIIKIRNLAYTSALDFEISLVLLKYKKSLLSRLEDVTELKRRQVFTLIELNVIEIKYQLMEQVFKIMYQWGSISTSLIPHVKAQIEFIFDNLLREMDDITTTEIEDIQREINRLHRMIEILPLLRICQNANQSTRQEILNVDNLINTLHKFDDEKNNTVKIELKSLAKKHSLLAVSEKEKQQIVKLIGLSKGHWYKCPNGHPYAIGECGGAMEESICVECKVPIGGRSHRLLPTNSVATFMDGATYSAYSDQQNMANYNLNDIL